MVISMAKELHFTSKDISIKIIFNSNLNKLMKHLKIIMLEKIEMLLEKNDRLPPSIWFKVYSV